MSGPFGSSLIFYKSPLGFLDGQEKVGSFDGDFFFFALGLDMSRNGPEVGPNIK